MKAILSVLLLIFLFLASSVNTSAMQITVNNLKNVLATYEQLHVLFHNPQCVHSRKYVQTFLKTDSDYKLGVVDCLRQIQLCNKYNLTYFPVLAKISSKQETTILDEQLFLVQHKLKSQSSDEAVLNRFVKYLDQEPHYAVVVFQDFGLPVYENQRISQNDEHIFYLQPYSEENPSNFTKLLSSLVKNQQGCWIIKKSARKSLQKYYCQSGFNRTITKKYIDLFGEGKLKQFIFSEEKLNQNSASMNALSMYSMLDQYDTSSNDICKLIYLHSSHCPGCSSRDISSIKKVLSEIKIYNPIQLSQFDIDKNQIAGRLLNIGLKRVPELIYVCGQKAKVFGKIFFLRTLREFISEHHQTEKSQEVPIQQSENKSDKRQDSGDRARSDEQL